MSQAEPVRRAIVLGNTALGVTTTVETVPIVKGFGATVNGLVVDGSPSQDAWTKTGRKLRVFEKGSQLTIGDWANYGEDRYGEAASQEIDPDNGWSIKTLSNYQWCARRIAQDIRRMDRLGIRHHQLVAPLTPAKQRLWLTRAAADEDEQPWTVGRLKKAMEEGEDLPVEKWYVLVQCPDGARQASLMDDLEAQGLSCKAVTRRARKNSAEAA